jgi:hypothetical protein
VTRAREAVSDAVLPATSSLTTREYGELARLELERYVRIQQRFFREQERYQSFAEAPADQGGFVMRYYDHVDGKSWFATLRHEDHGAIWCAVAVERVPVYVEGIVLKQSGQVRCSRDLATRVNALIRRVLPTRFTI